MTPQADERFHATYISNWGHLGGAIVEIGIAIGNGGTVSYAAENERAAPLSNHGASERESERRERARASYDEP